MAPVDCRPQQAAVDTSYFFNILIVYRTPRTAVGRPSQRRNLHNSTQNVPSRKHNSEKSNLVHADEGLFELLCGDPTNSLREFFQRLLQPRSPRRHYCREKSARAPYFVNVFYRRLINVATPQIAQAKHGTRAHGVGAAGQAVPTDAGAGKPLFWCWQASFV